MFVDADKHIGFRVTSGVAAARDVIKDRTKSGRAALAAVGRMTADSDERLLVEA